MSSPSLCRIASLSCLASSGITTTHRNKGAEMSEYDFRAELLSVIPNLRAFAMSLVGASDKADDLVQETLVRAWDKRSSYTPGTNLKGWLFTILRNEFYSQMRKRKREVSDPEGAMAERLSIHPEQVGRMDMEDFKAAV